MKEMKIIFRLLIIIFTNLYCINDSFGQADFGRDIDFSQIDFDTYKIDSNAYEFWWSKGSYNKFTTGDTIPYFVDIRQYKGVLNYGVTFLPTNGEGFSYLENFSMHKLHIIINHCVFNAKSNVIEIEGTITGGWPSRDRGWRGISNNVDVFIGKKKDTVSAVRIKHIIKSNNVDAFYRGEKVANHIDMILDTLPSFSMYDYTHYKTNHGNERTFKIRKKIEKNSILVFGLGSCYTVIYDIGELAFSNDIIKIKNKQIVRQTKDLSPDVIIRNNVQELDKKKSLKKSKSAYYLITEKAENYIIKKQYGKAKQQYDLFLKDDSYVFARDIHNAVRCAIFARDYKTTILWCEKLVLKGVGLQYFDAPIFNRIRKNILWDEFLKKFPMLNKKYKDGLNKRLIEGLDELVILDQIDYIKNAKGAIKRSELIKTTKYIDEKFISLIKKEGFPTEEKIGIQMSQNGMIIENPTYAVLIYHSYQTNRSEFPKINKIIDVSAKEYEYDAVRDYLEIFKKSGYTCLQIYKGNLYNNKTCKLDAMQIKKVAFRFNNVHNFIINAGEFIVIPFDYKNEIEDDKFIEERFEFVMKLTDEWLFYEK